MDKENFKRSRKKENNKPKKELDEHNKQTSSDRQLRPRKISELRYNAPVTKRARTPKEINKIEEKSDTKRQQQALKRKASVSSQQKLVIPSKKFQVKIEAKLKHKVKDEDTCTSAKRAVGKTIEEKAIRYLNGSPLEATVMNLMGAGEPKKIVEKIEVIMKKEKSKTEKIFEIIRVAEAIPVSDTTLIIFLKVINCACGLAVNYFTPIEIANVFIECAETFERRSQVAPPERACSSEISDCIKKELEIFRSFLRQFKNIDKKLYAKAHVKYLASAGVLYFYIADYENGKRDSEQVIHVLEVTYGRKVKTMSIYARACQQKASCCFALTNQDEGDIFLEKTFDAFYKIPFSRKRFSDVVALYTIVPHIIQTGRALNKTNLETSIFEKLQNRDELKMIPLEKTFNHLSLFWLSNLLGRNDTVLIEMKTLCEIEFPTPPPCMETALPATIYSVFFMPVGRSVELAFKLFRYTRDCGLLIKNVYKKFDFLNALVGSLVGHEPWYSQYQTTYTQLFSSVLTELHSQQLDPMNTWMYQKLCLSLLSFSYFYAVIGNYDECLEEVQKIFELYKECRCTLNLSFQILKASSNYLAAFAYFRKGDLRNTTKHLEEEIYQLFNNKTQCSHRMAHSITNWKFVNGFPTELLNSSNSIEMLCKRCTLFNIKFKRVYI